MTPGLASDILYSFFTDINSRSNCRCIDHRRREIAAKEGLRKDLESKGTSNSYQSVQGRETGGKYGLAALKPINFDKFVT